MTEMMVREFLEPSKGFRAPTYPDMQRTALYNQLHTGSYGTTTGGAIAVVRDSTFPMWGQLTLSFGSSGGALQAQQTSWHVPLTGSVIAAGETCVVDGSTIKLQDAVTGSAVQSYDMVGITAGMMNCGSPVLGIMPEVDSRPWFWIPKGWGLGLAISYRSEATSFGTSNVTPLVQLEFRGGPQVDYGSAQITMPVMTGAQMSSFITWPSSLWQYYGSNGVWVRPRLISFESDTGLTAASPLVAFNLLTSSQPVINYTTGAGAAMPTALFSGTNASGFQPFVNLAVGRTWATGASALISMANKVVSTSLRISNATKVVNQEGTIEALRYYENATNTLSNPPASFASFIPEDRAFLRMAVGIRTAVRPSADFEFFQDNRIELTASTYFSAFILRTNQHINFMRFLDPDAASASTLAFELRQNLEFLTNDVLLRPTFSPHTVAELHAAVARFARMPIFSPNTGVQHYNLVERKVKAVQDDKKPKAPAPKPKPKPKAEHKSNGNSAKAPPAKKS